MKPDEGSAGRKYMAEQSKNEQHKSVLFEESIDALNIVSDGIYIDGTLGRGGHSAEILKRLGPKGHLYAFDKDPEAIKHGEELFADESRFTLVHSSFENLINQADAWGIKGKVNGILLDLGVSSPQLDDAKRGFSFMRNGPLDMRMDFSQGMSAADWVAREKASEIAKVLKEYGEERYAKRIANAIVKARDEAPIETTEQLADIVAKAHPAWEKHKHPATRSFQAIRIHINEELTDLSKCLNQMLEVLAPKGRMAIISFHSLEDRIVKQFIKKQSKGDDFPVDLPVTASQLNQKLKPVGKMMKPTDKEIDENVRARSARLRVAELIA